MGGVAYHSAVAASMEVAGEHTLASSHLEMDMALGEFRRKVLASSHGAQVLAQRTTLVNIERHHSPSLAEEQDLVVRELSTQCWDLVRTYEVTNTQVQDTWTAFQREVLDWVEELAAGDEMMEAK